jgi:hypothetical protein
VVEDAGLLTAAPSARVTAYRGRDETGAAADGASAGPAFEPVDEATEREIGQHQREHGRDGDDGIGPWTHGNLLVNSYRTTI